MVVRYICYMSKSTLLSLTLVCSPLHFTQAATELNIPQPKQPSSSTFRGGLATVGTAITILALSIIYNNRAADPAATVTPEAPVIDFFTLETYRQMLDNHPNPSLKNFEAMYKRAKKEGLSQICDLVADQMRRRWQWDPVLKKFVR